MSRALVWIKEETRKILPAVIYFAIAFNVIHFATGLMLSPDAHRYYSYWTMTVSALIVGKVILIFNCFSFINMFPNKPLIYNILWKFFIYTLGVLIFKIIESFCELTYEYRSMQLAWENITSDLGSPIFWASFIELALAFIVFVVFSEFAQALGKAKVKKLLLG